MRWGVACVLVICWVSGYAWAQVKAPADTSLLPALPSASTSLRSLTLLSGIGNDVFRQPPLLGRRYVLGRHAFMPFVGLGFMQGTTSSPNGTVIRGTSPYGFGQDDRMMKDGLGKAMMPNEVQVGVRIPF